MTNIGLRTFATAVAMLFIASAFFVYLEVALQTIVRELTAASGRRVVLGTIPVNLLARTSGADGAANVPARALLTTMLANSGSALSWRLFYDPGLQMYALNVHIVRPPR